MNKIIYFENMTLRLTTIKVRFKKDLVLVSIPTREINIILNT